MEYNIIRLVDMPEWKEDMARWFHEKWGIPLVAYLDSMDECLMKKGAVWKFVTHIYQKAVSRYTITIFWRLYMIKIAVLTIKLYAPWVHSLKEKRMVVKSLMSKIRNKFQISVAEVQDQDIHQSIVIGIASIVPHNAQADSLMDEIINFVEQNTEAEIVDEEREIR